MAKRLRNLLGDWTTAASPSVAFQWASSSKRPCLLAASRKVGHTAPWNVLTSLKQVGPRTTSSVCGYAVVVLHGAVRIPFLWHLTSVCGLPPVANHHADWFACDHDRPFAWLLFQRMTLWSLLMYVLSGKIVFFWEALCPIVTF